MPVFVNVKGYTPNMLGKIAGYLQRVNLLFQYAGLAGFDKHTTSLLKNTFLQGLTTILPPIWRQNVFNRKMPSL